MEPEKERLGLSYRILTMGIWFELQGQYGNSSFKFVNPYSWKNIKFCFRKE